ncbi:hypothetical protein BX667DRAFT_495391 [Coemansia mojavensis]|nr:hypothetical protein BX667DRAFT_503233 [Coemansia mojavensis]KAI9480223.1 hypothetical protein BX667DRAFT_495391 [Coemansia mojavensis]
MRALFSLYLGFLSAFIKGRMRRSGSTLPALEDSRPMHPVTNANNARKPAYIGRSCAADDRLFSPPLLCSHWQNAAAFSSSVLVVAYSSSPSFSRHLLIIL